MTTQPTVSDHRRPHKRRSAWGVCWFLTRIPREVREKTELESRSRFRYGFSLPTWPGYLPWDGGSRGEYALPRGDK